MIWRKDGGGNELSPCAGILTLEIHIFILFPPDPSTLSCPERQICKLSLVGEEGPRTRKNRPTDESAAWIKTPANVDVARSTDALHAVKVRSNVQARNRVRTARGGW